MQSNVFKLAQWHVLSFFLCSCANCPIVLLHNKVSPPAVHQGFLLYVTHPLSEEKRSAELGEERSGHKKEKMRWEEIREGKYRGGEARRWDKTSGEGRRNKVRWKKDEWWSGERRGVPFMSTSTMLFCQRHDRQSEFSSRYIVNAENCNQEQLAGLHHR